MRIGVLTHLDTNPKSEYFGQHMHGSHRYFQEIDRAGHEPVYLDYQNYNIEMLGSGVQQSLNNNGVDDLLPDVDAVIPNFDNHVAKALWSLSALMLRGAVSTETPESISIAKNKLRSHMVLAHAGIPMPRTVAPLDYLPHDVDRLLTKVEPDPDKPLWVKDPYGTEGLGSLPVKNRAHARPLVEFMAANGHPFLIQESIEPPEGETERSDIRIVVMNGMIIASMLRVATGDEIRTGTSTGGDGQPYEPSPLMVDMALEGTARTGLKKSGVDIMISERGPLLLEINPFPGLKIERIADVNIAEMVVADAVERVEQTRSQAC